jgi:hypothetical protein
MTDPGHVGTADVAPPPFINKRSFRGGAYWGGAAPPGMPETESGGGDYAAGGRFTWKRCDFVS